MKNYYIAAFIPEKIGGYSVYIPDITNCFTCGNTIEEAMDMAEDVLATMLYDLVTNKKAIPIPSSFDRIRKQTEIHLQSIEMPIPENIQYQLVPAPSLDMVPVRVNISLPKAILEEIDKKASLYGFTRSGFIAKSAQAYK